MNKCLGMRLHIAPLKVSIHSKQYACMHLHGFIVWQVCFCVLSAIQVFRHDVTAWEDSPAQAMGRSGVCMLSICPEASGPQEAYRLWRVVCEGNGPQQQRINGLLVGASSARKIAASWQKQRSYGRHLRASEWQNLQWGNL